MQTSGPVVVVQLPEQLSAGEIHTFMIEVDPLLQTSRPRVVFDCSQIRSMDSAGVEMLLQCLEEAMKRDGDLKLASPSPQCEVVLELMRVSRVFETFESCDAAVRSFQALPVDPLVQDAPWYTTVFGELGALKQAS